MRAKNVQDELNIRAHRTIAACDDVLSSPGFIYPYVWRAFKVMAECMVCDQEKKSDCDLQIKALLADIASTFSWRNMPLSALIKFVECFRVYYLDDVPAARKRPPLPIFTPAAAPNFNTRRMRSPPPPVLFREAVQVAEEMEEEEKAIPIETVTNLHSMEQEVEGPPPPKLVPADPTRVSTWIKRSALPGVSRPIKQDQDEEGEKATPVVTTQSVENNGEQDPPPRTLLIPSNFGFKRKMKRKCAVCRTLGLDYEYFPRGPLHVQREWIARLALDAAAERAVRAVCMNARRAYWCNKHFDEDKSKADVSARWNRRLPKDMRKVKKQSFGSSVPSTSTGITSVGAVEEEASSVKQEISDDYEEAEKLKSNAANESMLRLFQRTAEIEHNYNRIYTEEEPEDCTKPQEVVKSFPCPIAECHKSFDILSYLQSHFQYNHILQGTLVVVDGNLTYKPRDPPVDMMRAFELEQKLRKCPVSWCMHIATGSMRMSLQEHSKAHYVADRLEYKCSECYEMFLFPYAIYVHVLIQCPGADFVLVPATTASEGKLRGKRALYPTDKEYKCPVGECKRSFDSKSGVLAHCRNVHLLEGRVRVKDELFYYTPHSEPVDKVRVEVLKRRLGVCPVENCGFIAYNHDAIVDHVRRRHKPKVGVRYECTHCYLMMGSASYCLMHLVCDCTKADFVASQYLIEDEGKEDEADAANTLSEEPKKEL